MKFNTEAQEKWYTQDYPHTEADGTVWLDPSGIRGENSGACFMCGANTLRLDINFMTFYCDSAVCNASIESELAKNGYESDMDFNLPEASGKEAGSV